MSFNASKKNLKSASEGTNRSILEFGPFRVHPDERLLLRSGHSVPLTGKAFDTFLVLLRRSGHL
jgi:DNA-binding response OmpR family regulator